GRFPFRANARAIANDELDGIVKFIADAKTDRVLGAHILQHAASELIAEAVSVIEFGGSSEDLARTCHSHPTLSEAVKEAAMSAETAPISAPKASANGVPNQFATAPASRLPSGIIAPKMRDQMPMTRPRISSGTIVCSTVLVVEKNRSIPHPAKKRNPRARWKFRVNENANNAAENN